MSAEIAVIVPVFNEADNILPMAREVAAALNPLGRSWELVFVDDASTDDTPQRIAEAAGLDTHVRGLRHQRNAGQSAAVWTGFTHTTSAILCTLDGDLQKGLDFGVAASALKHSIPGDFDWITRAEVERLMEGAGLRISR